MRSYAIAATCLHHLFGMKSWHVHVAVAHCDHTFGTRGMSCSAYVSTLMDVDGLVDEFALMFSLRERVPIHFVLFKRLAADLPHEGNAESTFSLSGSLSSDNKCSGPSALSTLVRINRNKAVCHPTRDATFKAYRSKFGKVRSWHIHNTALTCTLSAHTHNAHVACALTVAHCHPGR